MFISTRYAFSSAAHLYYTSPLLYQYLLSNTIFLPKDICSFLLEQKKINFDVVLELLLFLKWTYIIPSDFVVFYLRLELRIELIIRLFVHGILRSHSLQGPFLVILVFFFIHKSTPITLSEIGTLLVFNKCPWLCLCVCVCVHVCIGFTVLKWHCATAFFFFLSSILRMYLSCSIYI